MVVGSIPTLGVMIEDGMKWMCEIIFCSRTVETFLLRKTRLLLSFSCSEVVFTLDFESTTTGLNEPWEENNGIVWFFYFFCWQSLKWVQTSLYWKYMPCITLILSTWSMYYTWWYHTLLYTQLCLASSSYVQYTRVCTTTWLINQGKIDIVIIPLIIFNLFNILK